MKQKLLVSSILMGLAVAALPVSSLYAQSASDQGTQTQTTTNKKDKKEEQKLTTVVVTGSLIPQSQVETASPVITITSKQLETQGFRNVYDALHTIPVSTGSVQDSQVASNSFTPGATTISLFGLDPGFTLILLNGHPLTDYPLPYNGTQNITDLSMIPTEVVDHIDILSGGQSSLYGSSAVAGVVNIVLKKQFDGTYMNFRAGGYDNGGGANQRLQLAGGHQWGKLNATYSIDFEHQDPVRQFQTFFPSRLSNPLGQVAGRDFLQLEPFTGAYLDPGESTCNAMSNLFGGTLIYASRSGGRYYCGSYYDESGNTYLNSNKNASGYLSLNYAFNDNMEAYSDILFGVSKQRASGSPFWSFANPALAQSANGFSGDFWDNTVNDFEGIQRQFAPEEVGGLDANGSVVRTRQYNVDIGLRGNFGNSNWAYDGYYNRSQINANSTQRWPLNQPFQDYYLGAQQGIDPYGYGFPAFTPNLANFYKPLTPAQWLAMTDLIKSQSLSWQQNLHVTITNTDLFELPAGSVGFAGIAEIGNQAFNNPVDPRLIAGDFNNITGTQGAGSRNRKAIGGELRVPIISMLTADVSARYDTYSYGGRTDSKPTYKVGLEFRPIDTLLLRANYATAFRAPDMNYIFQKKSGFYTGATDYYYCRLQGYDASNLSDCQQANETAFSFYHGTPTLKDITAKTFGYGVVWSPTDKFELKADYTHIQINNEVETQSPDDLLQTEANCRLGVSLGGQAYDINSALCQNALAQVARYPADFPFALAQNQLQNVTTFPINIANERLSGIQASGTYRMDWGRYGNLALSAAYYVELTHEQQQQPGDPYLDLLHDHNSYEFKTRSSASVSWAVGNWTTTVYGILDGKASNYNGSATVGQWAQFNGSVQYAFSDNANVLFSVNNIGNRAPPTDVTVSPGNQYPPPYYNGYIYNGLGRIYSLQYNFKF